jgi:hypothetical protein
MGTDVPAPAAAEQPRKSTRKWAEEQSFDPQALFNKVLIIKIRQLTLPLFLDDLKQLLSLDKLWAKHKPPTPLSLEHALSLTGVGDLDLSCFH